MPEQEWNRESADRIEHVKVTQHGNVELREEIVEDVGAARAQILAKLTQFFWLGFGVLQALIAIRIILRLIGANPASTFVTFIYAFTDLFLWPFFGLISNPTVGNMVLEIPSIIAMLVYALLAWLVVKVTWLIFSVRPTRSVSTYERDRTIR